MDGANTRPPIDVVLDRLKSIGHQPKQSGSGWVARCPAHDDANPSLSIGVGFEGRVLLHCHSGCSHKAIVDAIGIREADLFGHADGRMADVRRTNDGRADDLKNHRHATETPIGTSSADARRTVDGRSTDAPTFPTAREAIAAYERTLGNKSRFWTYTDADGKPVCVVVRWERDGGKTYRPVSVRPDGQWVHGALPAPRPMYGLPLILAADPTEPVFIVEGEKAADAGRAMGLLTTTAAGGANAGHLTDWTPLKGRRVAIVPDMDTPGAKYAAVVAKACTEAGALSVTTIDLATRYADLPEGADLADVLDVECDDPQSIGADLKALVPPPPGPPDLPGVCVNDLIEAHPELRAVAIEGLLRRAETMNIVSTSKARKSWLVHGLCISATNGKKWLGKQVTKAPVLLIDVELHEETLSFRFKAIKGALGALDESTRDLRLWAVRGQNVTLDQISEVVSRHPPGTFGFIVLDALYRFMPPGMEENSNEAMTAVYNAIDRLARLSDAAVVIVHHTSKGDQADKAVTDMGAGAGAQSRAADTHLVLRQHEEDDCMVVMAAIRSFPPLDPFCIRFTYPKWELAPDLDPADLKRRGAKKDGGDKPDAEWTPERFARDIIGTIPKTRTAIVNMARAKGMSIRAAEAMLKVCEESATVETIKESYHDPARYRLAESSGLPG